jgi:type I restriction enzyme, S subunit
VSFPRYPKYKDSGVEWLGEVPEHWRVIPIRRAAKLESGHTPSRSHPEYWDNCTVPWFTLADVWQIREGKADYVFETEEMVSELGLANSSARLLPKGTVILSRTASVGFSTIMGVPMATTQDFANWVCGPDLQPEFLLCALRSMAGEFRRLMMGSTHNTIYMPDIQALCLALPPRDEQAAIAEYVKAQTRRIDSLLADQQRLVELLMEKRQAAVSHAVTKGLNPDAPMKPSGIEWLGEVPAHWDITPLRWAATCCSGDGLSADRVESHSDKDHAVPVIGGNGLMGYTHESNIERAVLAIGRVGALCGNIHIVYPPAWVTDNALILDADSALLDLHFLSSVLRSRNLNDIASKTAQPLITGAQVSDQRIPAPPPREQREITAFLSRELGKLDTLTAEAGRAIDLLQERRTALISAAVTGQIDVRDLVKSDAA